ncbi:MAG TPA: TonB family protein [Terriglobales bacterium]|nr:TonB family protein [Terriglobales bacterium]
MSVPGSAAQQNPSNLFAARKIQVQLNWELPPWLPSLRENLAWFFQRESAPAPLGFRPGVFWRDVFVDQQLNWKALTRSYAAHLIFAGLVYVLSLPFYAHRFAVLETLQHDHIVYINPNEDILPSELPKEQVAPRKLAPVISRSSRARVATKGDSAKRPAEAMAIPKWADNTTHTIVAPTAPKIFASAPIPDIVLASPVPQAPPVAAVASTPKLVAPVLDVTPVAPPPDTSQARLSMPSLPQASAIAPPVQTNNARNLASINIAPLPEAVNPEPKLPVAATHAIPNLGSVEPVAPAPDLKNVPSAQVAKALPGPAQPVAPPPDAKALAGATGIAGNLPGTAEPVAPPPDVSGAGTAASASGELISLNLNPVAGPPRLPDGSRRGAFAGNPEASEKGTGVPDRQAGGRGPGGDSSLATKDELGIVAAAVPHGIVNGLPIVTAQDLRGNSAGNSLLAMARAPRMSLPPPRVAPIDDVPNAVDERIFRGRKYYTMALNKPNLTSAGGSWIFRFAERGTTSKPGEVTAPIPLREVDAAYPADMMRDNVQGIVILYAVIRSDGSVAEVKVLEGFDDRLDENARRALSAWHFVPGTRDGNPVDLEAVVRIPFRSKRGF